MQEFMNINLVFIQQQKRRETECKTVGLNLMHDK